jgi:hypothetical protein
VVLVAVGKGERYRAARSCDVAEYLQPAVRCVDFDRFMRRVLAQMPGELLWADVLDGHTACIAR